MLGLKGGEDMNKKNFLVVILAGLISVSIGARPAEAGNVQRNRWEGVAIGVGAAVLGGILWNHARNDRHGEPAIHYRKPSHPVPGRYHPRGPAGHWKVRKVWVAPKYKKIWNPGHYNRRGRWMPGQWIRVEKRPGYWKKERVRVAGKGRRSYYR